MGIQPAVALQERSSRVFFTVLLASLLFFALLMALTLRHFSGGLALAPFLTAAGALALLISLALSRYLKHLVAAQLISPLVEPLVRLEGTLRGLANDEASLPGPGGIVIDTDVREILSLAEATSQLVDRIRHMGLHDPLTGIYNRAFFEWEMQRLAASGNETVGFIMGDLDDLKMTNDTLGHKAGDFLLRTAAMILQSAVREDDVLARIGGDEFVIIVQDCREEDLETIIERINERIKAFNLGNGKVQLGISLGYAFGHLDDHDLSDILKEADSQMYLDKGTVIQGVLPLHQQSLRSGRRSSRKRDSMVEPPTERDILDSLHLF